jgi:hypothetical protein
MNRKPVSSSNISSVGYDERSHTLEVEFHSRAVYQYYGVPAAVFHGLLTASSVGSYFAVNVKKAGYSFRQVG